MFWVWVNEKRMERRSRRRRTVRRQNRQQESFHGAKPPNPDISGRGLDPGNNSFPPDASEMVTRIRAEGRNIAPDPLTKHHLTGEGSDASFKAESPKAEGSNFVSGLFKQISDKTGLEWVRWWQWLKSCQSGFGKIILKNETNFIFQSWWSSGACCWHGGPCHNPANQAGAMRSACNFPGGCHTGENSDILGRSFIFHF